MRQWLVIPVAPNKELKTLQKTRWLGVRTDRPDKAELLSPERVYQLYVRADERCEKVDRYNEILAEENGQLRRRLRDGS